MLLPTQRQDINKKDKTRIFEILAKMANFAKDENEKFKWQIFDWRRFISDSLKRGIKPFFNIFSALLHRTEPIINIWGKTLGDP